MNIKKDKETIIKHIVISGGGITGFTAYGIMKESEKSGFWNINNIKTFYGTSIGGVLLIILALKFEWDILDDYIIKRPWHHVFNFDMYSLINSIQTMGIFNIKTVESIFDPLFKAKDIKIDVTMKEFYDITGIEIHLYATDFIETKSVDISYKTHPEWTVIEAVYCSCCLPILFSPYRKNEILYYDGGVFSNYPLINCCNNGAEHNEIFGIKSSSQNMKNEITDKSSLFDYIAILIKKIITNLSLKNEIVIKNEIIIETDFVSIYDIYLALSNIDNRTNLIEEGIILWEKFGVEDGADTINSGDTV